MALDCHGDPSMEGEAVHIDFLRMPSFSGRTMIDRQYRWFSVGLLLRSSPDEAERRRFADLEAKVNRAEGGGWHLETRATEPPVLHHTTSVGNSVYGLLITKLRSIIVLWNDCGT